MSISLGYDPIPLKVHLARDSDFVATLLAEDGWADGTRIELRFLLRGATVVWAATVDGTDASWHVPAADVAALVGADPRGVRLHYLSGDGADLLWARGQVVTA